MNADQKINANQITPKLIAPCGMDCGLCRAHLREKNKCPGCSIPDSNKPITRVRCKIKTCNVFQKGKAKFCFECNNFPCDNLRHLDRRYQIKYHASMIENLENIKKSGMRKFIKNEKIKWTCSKCNSIICVHDGRCSGCGKVSPSNH